MQRPTIRCWRLAPQSANLVVRMPLCFSFKVADTSVQYNTFPGDRLNDFGFNIDTFYRYPSKSDKGRKDFF